MRPSVEGSRSFVANFKARAAQAGRVVGAGVLALQLNAAMTQEVDARTTSIGLTPVTSSLQCPDLGDQVGVRILRTQAEYDAFREKFKSRNALPELDMARRDVVVFNGGERPSMGYKATTTGVTVDKDKRRINVSGLINTPVKGRSYATVMTQPCDVDATDRNLPKYRTSLKVTQRPGK